MINLWEAYFAGGPYFSSLFSGTADFSTITIFFFIVIVKYSWIFAAISYPLTFLLLKQLIWVPSSWCCFIWSHYGQMIASKQICSLKCSTGINDPLWVSTIYWINRSSYMVEVTSLRSKISLTLSEILKSFPIFLLVWSHNPLLLLFAGDAL